MNTTNDGLPWGSLHGIRPVKHFTKLMAQGMADDDIARYMKQRYGLWDEKIEVALAIAHKELALMRGETPDNISLYIGIPFCPTRCAYCSFVSAAVGRMANYVEPYLAALKQEITAAAHIVKELGLTVRNVYFGGGTPTTLSAAQLDDLMYTLACAFDFSHMLEYTVEAGRPDTITRDKLRSLKRNGAGRISINPQTMCQATLDRIGRRHTVEQITDAYALAREIGFDVINMDLIAGLPGEQPADFRHSLNMVCGLSPENITVHTMCIKRAADLHERKSDLLESGRQTVREMISYAYQKLGASGYAPYYLYRQKDILGDMENVGFSTPGTEGRYNIFIMEEIQTILSLGCGGVTKMVRGSRIERIFNVKDIIEYINRIDEMIDRKNGLYPFLQPAE